MKTLKIILFTACLMLVIGGYAQNDAAKTQEMEQQEAEKIALKNLEEGQKFLAENKTKEGVLETPSGLQYKILTKGNGPIATAVDTVEVNYIGTLIDGTKFDSSYDKGRTATFAVGRVIKGWTEGLQLVPEGSKVMLYIPSELAYGNRQRGPVIQANSTLIFEIEVIKVKKFVEKE